MAAVLLQLTWIQINRLKKKQRLTKTRTMLKNVTAAGMGWTYTTCYCLFNSLLSSGFIICMRRQQRRPRPQNKTLSRAVCCEPGLAHSVRITPTNLHCKLLLWHTDIKNCVCWRRLTKPLVVYVCARQLFQIHDVGRGVELVQLRVARSHDSASTHLKNPVNSVSGVKSTSTIATRQATKARLRFNGKYRLY